ncbi:MAG: hypothetical protein SFH39_00385 [Candidatus Magnetobacterium sp. LHC-1]
MIDEIKNMYIHDPRITQLLKCDYYGYNKNGHLIIEYKSTISDLEKSIMQIFRYHDSLYKIKTPNMIKKSIRLIICWKHPHSKNVSRKAWEAFKQYIILYKKYVKSDGKPNIEFYFGCKKVDFDPIY